MFVMASNYKTPEERKSFLLNSQLSIQNIIAGGNPIGGLQGSTNGWPFWSVIGSSFSLVHNGDPIKINNMGYFCMEE